ncbi:hypothetical protein LY78DRAFT_709908 [Colletotrichum sublineola]|nr:hypothetical protein LY78DRAFT_709908 [Colletotrichum sublineola]
MDIDAVTYMHSELRIIVSCARLLPFCLFDLYTYFSPRTNMNSSSKESRIILAL